jgi:hypothetical protein
MTYYNLVKTLLKRRKSIFSLSLAIKRNRILVTKRAVYILLPKPKPLMILIIPPKDFISLIIYYLSL